MTTASGPRKHCTQSKIEAYVNTRRRQTKIASNTHVIHDELGIPSCSVFVDPNTTLDDAFPASRVTVIAFATEKMNHAAVLMIAKIIDRGTCVFK